MDQRPMLMPSFVSTLPNLLLGNFRILVFLPSHTHMARQTCTMESSTHFHYSTRTSSVRFLQCSDWLHGVMDQAFCHWFRHISWVATKGNHHLEAKSIWTNNHALGKAVMFWGQQPTHSQEATINDLYNWEAGWPPCALKQSRYSKSEQT